jgi:outer membrane biosynthesis protein TonB
MTKSPREQKNEITAMAGSVMITGLLLFVMTLIGFTTPIPPFPPEPGGLEIALGEAYMGGPEDVAARLGGEVSDPASAPTGGGDDVVTQDDPEPTVVLPPINPPKRDRPAEVVNNDKPVQPQKPTTDLPTINRQRGNGQSGVENGDPNGTGTQGRGDGLVRGNQGDPNGTGQSTTGGLNPGTGGGLIGGHSFRGTRPSVGIRTIQSNGEGDIKVQIKIDCNGRVAEIQDTDVRGSTYSAEDQDEVARMLIRNLKFTELPQGDCPQVGIITFKLKRSL